MIQFIEVSKKYRDFPNFALENVSFQINDGEFVFLVGSSGSGKSSVLKLLSAEEKATSGQVLFNTQNVGELSNKNIPFYRRKIGIVFQNFRLLTTRTVYDNLAFAMEVLRIDPWFIDDRVIEVLKLVGLDGLQDRYPYELSGGEQQRVAIARAIINRPSLLLADEPTGNLDFKRTRETIKLFEKINEITGTTVILVTHEQQLVNSMNKRIIHLEKGRLIADYVNQIKNVV